VTGARSARNAGVRPFLLAWCLAILVVAGCGDDEDRPVADDPDQAVSSTPDPSPPPAGEPTPPAECKRLGRRLVGDPVEAAEARAERRGCVFRVAVVDGEGQALTDDFQPGRINVRVVGGLVSAVEFMG
jgi:hypothetical protein